MNTALHRRLIRLEKIAGRKHGAESTATLIEPAAEASAEQWRQFFTSKANAEAAGLVIIAIRSAQPAQPIAYRARVVIVPPKIRAIVEVRPLLERNAHAH